MIKEFVVRYAFMSVLLLAAPICTSPTATSYRSILRVKPPLRMAALPGLRCYYKGYSYKLDDLCAVLPNEVDIGLITIIITPCVEPVYKSHLPNHWALNESLPVRWFECTKKAPGEWAIAERNRDEVPYRIPESALVVLIHPDLIAGVSAPPAEAEGTTLHNLPIIVFKQNAHYDEEEILSTICALPDIETFHQPADGRSAHHSRP